MEFPYIVRFSQPRWAGGRAEFARAMSGLVPTCLLVDGKSTAGQDPTWHAMMCATSARTPGRRRFRPSHPSRKNCGSYYAHVSWLQIDGHLFVTTVTDGAMGKLTA